MQCDVCKTKKAEVFLTQIVGGKMQKVNLCHDCSKAKGVEDPAGFALADLLLGMGDSQEVEPSPPMLKCPVCGFTQADFKKTGRLGCSGCYEAFEEGLTPLLKSMHKGIEHIGKLPVHAAKHKNITLQLEDLRRNLEKAIQEEHYEMAASLRDQIRNLETEIPIS